VSVTVLILLGLAFLAGALAGMFALLVAGIRSDDRRRDIHLAPGTRAESASRRLLVNIRHAGPGDDNEKDA
jgi:hypothetical protein